MNINGGQIYGLGGFVFVFELFQSSVFVLDYGPNCNSLAFINVSILRPNIMPIVCLASHLLLVLKSAKNLQSVLAYGSGLNRSRHKISWGCP